MMQSQQASLAKQQDFSNDFAVFASAARKDTVDLKLDILKMQGQGFSTAEIVQSLTAKYGLKQGDIYYHIRSMPKWKQFFVTAMEGKEAYQNNLTRLDYIYRELSFLYQHAQTDIIKLGCLNSMAKTIIGKADLIKNNDVNELAQQIAEIKESLVKRDAKQ